MDLITLTVCKKKATEEAEKYAAQAVVEAEKYVDNSLQWETIEAEA